MSDTSDDIWYCWKCAWSGSSEAAASKHSGTVGGHIVSQARLRPLQPGTPASDAVSPEMTVRYQTAFLAKWVR